MDISDKLIICAHKMIYDRINNCAVIIKI